MFCFDMNLTDDWTLASQPQERANYQLALYATHLATGSTLFNRSIKASTINLYLTGIAKFLGRFRDVDPRYVSSADTHLAPVIAKVIAEQRRWETVPNRREPFTLPMYQVMATRAANSPDTCGLQHALANWALINLYAGCRGAEWAQPSTACAPLESYFRNHNRNAYAFTLADVRCSTDTGALVPLAQALTNPASVGKIHLRFEEQKNGNHNEKKLFVRNHANPRLCFIRALLQILQRNSTLIGFSAPEFPLSIYRRDPAPDSPVFNITTADVERSIRSVAAELFSLDPILNKKELQLWSAQSFRVGACATLYANGFSAMEIKFLLRWKSDAFMTYLRNIAVTSRRHNTALNETDEMPNFL